MFKNSHSTKELDKCISDMKKQGIDLDDEDINYVIFNAIFCVFCRHILDGVVYYVTDEYDPPWDNSGTLLSDEVDPEEYLSRTLFQYKLISEWSEETHTGDSSATYISGSGLYFDTYDSNTLSLALTEFLSIRIKEKLKITEKDMWDGKYDEISELDEICELEMALSVYCDYFELRYCWEMASDYVKKQIEEEDRISHESHLRSQEMKDTCDLIVGKHLTKYKEYKIESPNKKEFMVDLLNIFSTLDIKELEAFENSKIDLNLSIKMRVLCSEEAGKEIKRRAQKNVGD